MDKTAITGLVLAGGLGRRMGGADKGLSLLAGRPLLAHVLERLRPQVGAVLINANRSGEAYAGFGHPVIADRIAGFAGPLAGLEAGLAACTTELLLSVPCDSPFLPADLAERMLARMQATTADIVVAESGGRLHPVFALARADLLDGLSAHVASGGRRMLDWLDTQRWAACPWETDAPFTNINTPDQLRAHTPGDLPR